MVAILLVPIGETIRRRAIWGLPRLPPAFWFDGWTVDGLSLPGQLSRSGMTEEDRDGDMSSAGWIQKPEL